MRWKLSLTMLCVLLGLSLPAWAQSGDSPGGTQLNKVDALEVVEGEDGTYIRLSGSEVPTFSVFKLNDPLRLFVDISNSEIAKHTLTEDVQNGVISRVALIEFEDSYQRVARLIIGFDRAAHYDVRTEGNEVVVFIDGAQRRGQNSQSLTSVERELQQKQERLSAAERRLSDSEQRYGQAVGQLDATRVELSRAKAELEAMQARVASTSGQERRDLEAAITSHNAALKTAQAQVDERERQVKTMAGQIADLEAQRVQSQRQHQAALERANERAVELEKSLSRTQQELATISAQKESAQGRLTAMSAEVNQTTARVQAQRQQLEEAQKREAELESQLNQLRASAASGNQNGQQALASVERERAQWQSRMTQYTRDLEQAQAQQAQSQQRMAEFEKMVSARDAEIARLKSSQSAEQVRLLSDSEQRYGHAVGQLDATRGELSRSRAELEAMQARVASTSGQERRDLEAAIASHTGALKAGQAQVDERERQVKTMAGKIAELEAQRVESQRQHQAALEGANERTVELEKSLNRTQQELATIAAEKESAQGRLTAMSAEVKQTTARVQAQRQQLEGAQKREAELEAQLNHLRASAASGNQNDQQALASVERERAQWQSRMTQYSRDLDQAQAQQAQSQQRMGEFEKMVNARDAEIARLKSSQSAEQRRLSQVLEQRAALEQELAAARRELASNQAESARQAELRDARPAAQAVPVDAAGANTVRGIRLETTPEGRSRIVVELDRPGQFETLPWKESRAVMILNNVELPRHLERTLSADAQGGAVRFVSSFSQRDGQVRMEAELRSDASEMIHQEGNQLVWEFASAVAQGGQGAGLGQDGQPRRSAEGESFTAAPPNYPRVVTDLTRVTSVPGMSRKRLTIDLRNADIQNVLRLIAQEGGVNIIASSGVSGAVTMRLRSVPLDQVFLTILQSLQLGFELRGNVIRVAPQSVLAAEEGARAEARARAQRVQPLEVFLLPVNYASAGDLSNQVSGLLSPRGSVTVDARTNTLIVKDLSENLGSIRMLIESLDAQVPQVLIEARIVETNDTFARQIGVQWGGDISFSQGNGNPTGLIFPSVLGVAGGATDGQTPTQGTSPNPNFAVNLPAPAGTGAGGAIGLTMGSVGGGVNLNLRLSAMEEAGHAKIVSSPRILTLDNTEATISQGTSIPISVVSAAGIQTQFVDASLELTVTPHVTPDGNIRLAIQATKNEPDFQNTGARGDPTIIRRQAQTELLIKDGDTTVIGGIYTRNAGRSTSVVPFFHRIPILGFFFRTTSESERRSELLIFITPRIVNRAEALGVMSAGTLRGSEEIAPGAAQ